MLLFASELKFVGCQLVGVVALEIFKGLKYGEILVEGVEHRLKLAIGGVATNLDKSGWETELSLCEGLTIWIWGVATGYTQL